MSRGQEFISFRDVVPYALATENLVSGAPHLVNKIKREFYPFNRGDYSPDENRQFDITIESSDMYLVPQSCYLRFEFHTVGTLDGSVNDTERQLEEGGAHNCFSRFDLMTPSQTIINTSEAYDRLSNVLMNTYFQGDHINGNEWRTGDGPEGVWEDPPVYCKINGTVQLAANPGNEITGTGTSFQFLKVGQPVRIVKTATPQRIAYEGFIETIQSSTTMYVTPCASFTIGVAHNLEVGARSARVRAAGFDNTSLDDDGIVLNIRPHMGFFNMTKIFPLAETEGLLLRGYLREARFALRSHAVTDFTTSKTLDYKLSNVKLVCEMIKPSAEIRANMQAAMLNRNLAFIFPAYYHTSRTESGEVSSEQELTINCKKHSIRRMFWTVQNVRARGTTNSASNLTDVYTYPSKTFIDGRIVQYQVSIGSEDYPRFPVQFYDAAGTEVFDEFCRTFNINRNAVHSTRFTPVQWGKWNQNSNIYGDCDQSLKVIFSTSFATLPDDPMSGIDTAENNASDTFIVKLLYDAVNRVGGSISPRYFDFWFEYANILMVRPDGSLSVFN